MKVAAADYGWEVFAEAVVPDEVRDIQRVLREQVNKGCHLVLTTGGTGIASRDVTPEAVREMAVRELPGFGELMRTIATMYVCMYEMMRTIATLMN